MTELDIAFKAVKLYAAQHPRPSQVNITQAAEMLNLSRPTVSRLLKTNVIKMNNAGMISISEIDKVLESRS